MKQFKRMSALLLALVMILSLGTTALADNSDVNTGTIEIMNPQEDVDYTASRIFDVTYDDDKFAYTIDKDSIWLSTVQAYANASDTTDADGLTLEAVTGANDTVELYNVSITDDFDAATFAAALKAATERTASPVEPTAGDGYTLAFDPDTETTANQTLKKTGLPLGYWLVLPSTGALANLSTTSSKATIYDKNEMSKAEKTIIDRDNLICAETAAGHTHTDDCYGRLKINEAPVGETIPFEIKTRIPKMTGYDRYFFIVEDTMTCGLKLVNTPNDGKNPGIVVTITDHDEDPAEIITLTEGVHYEVKIEELPSRWEWVDEYNGQKVRIIFKDMIENFGESTNEEITVRYDATLVQEVDNENDDYALNTAQVVYSNDPAVKPVKEPDTSADPDADPDDPTDPGYEWPKDPSDSTKTVDPTGRGPSSDTRTYTALMWVNKKNENGRGLKGAEFTLTAADGVMNQVRVGGVRYVPYVDQEGWTESKYYKLKDGNYTTAAPIWIDTEEDKANYWKYDGAVLNGTTGTVPEYMEVCSVWVDTVTDPTDAVKGFVTNDYCVDFYGLGVGEYVITESIVPDGYHPRDPMTIHIRFSEGDPVNGIDPFFYIEENWEDTDEDGVVDMDELPYYPMCVDFINVRGFELPETGGNGTTVFYLIGGILLAGAAVLLITKKRMAA